MKPAGMNARRHSIARTNGAAQWRAPPYLNRFAPSRIIQYTMHDYGAARKMTVLPPVGATSAVLDMPLHSPLDELRTVV
jgi:hypothetical protein